MTNNRNKRMMQWVMLWIMIFGLQVGAVAHTSERGSTKATVAQSDELREAERFSQQVAELYQLGKYYEAIPIAERALVLFEKALGPEHPDVAMGLNNLAELYRAGGDFNKAEPLYERALGIVEKKFGPEHPDIATGLNNLGELYRERGDYDKAEQFHKRALAMREKLFGPEHPDLIVSLDNLAGLYSVKAEYNKAESLLLRSQAIGEKTLGPDHPDTAQVLQNLGKVYRARGDYDKAELSYKKFLTKTEKALGPQHPNFAIGLINLGELYARMGDDRSAEPLYKRALVIGEKALGPEHPYVIVVLNNLAGLYKRRGDYDRAEPIYRRTLSIRERTLGPEHADCAVSLNDLAVLYHLRGDYNKAEPLYRRALAISEKALGLEHPEIATTLHSLSALYQAKGEMGAAVALTKRACEIEEHNLALIIATGVEAQKRAYMKTLSGGTYSTVSLHVRDNPNNIEAARLALTTVLRRKGRVLDAIVENQQALRTRLSPDEQATLTKLNDKSSQLGALAFRGHGNMKPEQYRAQMKMLEEETRELETGLILRVGEFRAQSHPITLKLVQQLIPGDAALVEVVLFYPFDAKALKEGGQWGTARYIAYVLKREGEPACVDLGEAETIDRAVKNLLGAFHNPQIPDLAVRARGVDEMLMRPIRKLLGATQKVLLSPDGELNKLPFGALLNEESRYLIEQYSLSYLTSGRDLLRLRVHTQSRGNPLVVANPAFDDDSSGFSTSIAAKATSKAEESVPNDEIRPTNELDRIQIHDWIDLIQLPVLPRPHLIDHFIRHV